MLPSPVLLMNSDPLSPEIPPVDQLHRTLDRFFRSVAATRAYTPFESPRSVTTSGVIVSSEHNTRVLGPFGWHRQSYDNHHQAAAKATIISGMVVLREGNKRDERLIRVFSFPKGAERTRPHT